MDQIWALGRTRREPSRPGPFPFAFPVGRGPVTAPSEFERALGALYGLAIGDALGMPTQLLSPEELDRRFGAITWFQPAPDNHPIAAGLPAGHITDDTEQALLIARLLIDGGGRIEPLTLANALADWERDMVRRGSLDLLGPSTQRAISAVAAGIPGEEAARFGAGGMTSCSVFPAGWSARGWPKKILCPPLSRSCERQATAVRGTDVSSQRRWAETATPSLPSQGRSRAHARESVPFRRTR